MCREENVSLAYKIKIKSDNRVIYCRANYEFRLLKIDVCVGVEAFFFFLNVAAILIKYKYKINYKTIFLVRIINIFIIF